MNDVQAKLIVREYVGKHLDASDPAPHYDVFIVWKCKVLQNCKYLLSTTLHDGMYYELTYSGDKHIAFLDAYKKFENVVIDI